MTKQEKIQEAWVEMQSHIESEGVPKYNDDGWAKYGRKQESEWFKLFEEKEWLGYLFYRPKSLQGIENNNGWIKIESKDDLPKEDCNIHIFKDNLTYVAFYDSDYKEFSAGIMPNIKPTHYQPIVKPQPPIY